ncbi:hypothetical protein BGZ80_010863 [Entomortierella chlamydospora]|uniref:Uncharacterized protein n=1 Tax=Entomortierella chlamydospora TaxID=101097 RepID=A0A9P6MUY1_9FUNG|nr:hypothetical protein BGZ79_010686 [Entomortierella chlamydospora]KAG0013776.1 hypothetical protein BGZ80_010863 [Entomortierella chlamydospora]
MKLLLKLSLAAMVVSSAMAAMTVEQFIDDPKVKALAPHLLQEITSQGTETFDKEPQNLSKLTSGLKPPLLDDIAQIVSLNIFRGDNADWSKLEEAKVKAIQEYGAEALTAAANLQEIDNRRASLITNTIYDTVIQIPQLSKESYNEMKASIKKEVKEDIKSEGDEKNTEEEENVKEGSSSSSLWDILGFSLIKSSDTARKAKNIVSSSNICETTNTEYLKGVDDVVYYSSLAQGLAGGALVSASPDSAIKSPELQTMVSSVSKLAVAIQMAQSVARLAGLDPSEPQVRTMTLLALTSDNALSPSAMNARDINNLVNKKLDGEIPSGVLQTFADQAAFVLITKGPSSNNLGSAVFSNVPIFRNIMAFSSEVLNANDMGDVLKFVFCPEIPQAAEIPKAYAVVEDINKKAKDSAEVVSDQAQKVFKAPEGIKENIKDIKDEAERKGSEADAAIKDKVTEGTEKVNAAGEKLAENVKGTTEEAKQKAAGAKQKATEAVKNAKGKVAEKAEEKKQEL